MNNVELSTMKIQIVQFFLPFFELKKGEYGKNGKIRPK